MRCFSLLWILLLFLQFFASGNISNFLRSKKPPIFCARRKQFQLFASEKISNVLRPKKTPTFCVRTKSPTFSLPRPLSPRFLLCSVPALSLFSPSSCSPASAVSLSLSLSHISGRERPGRKTYRFSLKSLLKIIDFERRGRSEQAAGSGRDGKSIVFHLKSF